ncbi:MAG: winged helix-turn-helix domain-containing protein [Microthrixaceae bacterium]|nr:winged helix-turn-helix domain-containing protein [Microthrixaceae bacterium]
MDIRILGSLEAGSGGHKVDLGLRQARVVLGVLALRAGSAVRTAELADQLWPGGPPPSWEGTVQSHVSRLRRALEPDRRPREPSTRITTHGDAYVLHLDDDEMDARRFENGAAAARAAMAKGEHHRALELFEQALAEWRGPVLADLGDSVSLIPEVGRLEELRTLAGEERCEALLAVGGHRRAVADLEAMVEANPLRERCWELLPVGSVPERPAVGGGSQIPGGPDPAGRGVGHRARPGSALTRGGHPLPRPLTRSRGPECASRGSPGVPGRAAAAGVAAPAREHLRGA